MLFFLILKNFKLNKKIKFYLILIILFIIFLLHNRIILIYFIELYLFS